MRFIYDRNKTAVIYKDRHYSYRDLLIYLKYYASIFDAKPGEKVVIFMENRPEVMFCLFAVWERKCVAVVADAESSIEQLAYMLRDSEASYIFTTDAHLKVARRAMESVEQDVRILNFDEISLPADFLPDEMEMHIEDRAQVAVILYTSGTTGEPKGVMLTYDNLLSQSDSVKETGVIVESDRFLAMLPFHHVLPLNTTIILPIYFGTFVVILDELNSEALKKAMKENQLTVIIGVPRIYELLHKGIMAQINRRFLTRTLFNWCKKINSFTLNKIIFGKVGRELGGAIKLLVSGGAKLDAGIGQNLYTLGLPVIEGYGLTETSPLISFTRPWNIKIGSVGEPIPHVEVKVAEDEELLVRGPNVMKGYYNKPEATWEVIDADGWLHTGDLATVTDNVITIIGRKKEMIVLSNGKNINPADIENEIIRGSNLIREIAVTEHENHLIAIVYPDFDLVRKNKVTNIAETLKWEIIDKYNLTAPAYRKILEIKTVKDELPKTRIGKIRRFMLAEFLKAHENDEGQETPATETAVPEELKDIYGILKENIETGRSVKVTPEAHMELDLGLDSLDMVEILSFIENSFSVKISEDKLSEMKNILEIVRYIHENGGAFEDRTSDLKDILAEEIPMELPKLSPLSIFAFFLIRICFKLYFRMRVIGREKIVGNQYIIAGNHQSYLDALYVPIALPRRFLRDTYFLAVAIHFDSPFRRWIARQCNVILIDINKNLKLSLQMAAKVLKEGKNLVIFPEGARTRDGNLQPFKKTFALLSTELGIPVLPFGIDGSFAALPFGTTIPKPAKVTLRFFDPVVAESGKADELISTVTTEIREFILSPRTFG
ncbi:MAG: AMP-binding protein [Fusobacteriaceae bacterium]|nr:AMP-binding protein [Fusobacteriaceae bacterium]